MLRGFREFLLRGNVVDLAVAVVIGAAFNAVVERVVDAVITPIIGMFFRADSLDTALEVALPGGGVLAFGAVIGGVLNFVIVAAVVYFVFVLPMNSLRARANTDPAERSSPSEQELLTEIRDLLRAQQGHARHAGPREAEPEAAADGGAVHADEADRGSTA